MFYITLPVFIINSRCSEVTSYEFYCKKTECKSYYSEGSKVVPSRPSGKGYVWDRVGRGINLLAPEFGI